MRFRIGDDIVQVIPHNSKSTWSQKSISTSRVANVSISWRAWAKIIHLGSSSSTNANIRKLAT